MSDTKLAHYEIKDKMAPDSIVKVAFGDWNVPGLSLQFQNGSHMVRSKILEILLDILTRRELIVEALRCGLVSALHDFIRAPISPTDQQVEATKVLSLSLKVQSVRDALVREGVLLTISQDHLKHSQSVELRRAIFSFTLSLCSQPPIAFQAYSHSYLHHFYALLSTEKDIPCLTSILNTLSKLTLVDRLNSVEQLPNVVDVIGSLIDEQRVDSQTVDEKYFMKMVCALLNWLALMSSRSLICMEILTPLIPKVITMDKKFHDFSFWKFLSTILSTLKKARIIFCDETNGLQLLVEAANSMHSGSDRVPDYAPVDYESQYAKQSIQIAHTRISQATHRSMVLLITALCEYPKARSFLKSKISREIFYDDKCSQTALKQLLWEP